MNELEALVTLNQLPTIGPVRIRRLIDYFGCASEVFTASASAISEVPRCNSAVADIILNWRNLSDTAYELNECETHGIQLLTPDSPHWPAGLRDSQDAPVLLYSWGKLDPTEDASPVAVIGSRKTTNYGRTVTQQFSRQLAHTGHTIISGLALGIDTIAHQAALDAGQRTIAVLGSGLGSLYPRQNYELATAISQQGAVVSEYPLRTNPDKQTFPQRNRIVAAWAKATLITEMPERSGAMITANFARELGRPIFAIPGPIDRPSSAGCNLLIQQGAILASTSDQISKALTPSMNQLEFFSEDPAMVEANLSILNEQEKAVLAQLTSHEQTIEELHLTTQMAIPDLTIALFNLELNEMAKQHPGMTYTSI